VMASPFCVMAPAVAGSSPATSRSRVDLPQPLGPSSATNSPGRTCRSTPSSTCSTPPDTSNQWLTPRMSMCAPAAVCRTWYSTIPLSCESRAPHDTQNRLSAGLRVAHVGHVAPAVGLVGDRVQRALQAFGLLEPRDGALQAFDFEHGFQALRDLARCRFDAREAAVARGNLGGEIAAEDRARRGVVARVQGHRNLHHAFRRLGNGHFGAADQGLADSGREFGLALGRIVGSPGPVQPAALGREQGRQLARDEVFQVLDAGRTQEGAVKRLGRRSDGRNGVFATRGAGHRRLAWYCSHPNPLANPCGQSRSLVARRTTSEPHADRPLIGLPRGALWHTP